MRGTSSIIYSMARGSIDAAIATVRGSKENGCRGCRTEKESKRGMTGIGMKGTMLMGKNRGKGNLFELTGQNMRVISLIIISMELGSINGQISACTMEAGTSIRCTARARLLGLMEGAISENMREIKSMARGLLIGRTEQCTRESGKTGSSTGGVLRLIKMVFRGMANGSMGRGCGGLRKQKRHWRFNEGVLIN